MGDDELEKELSPVGAIEPRRPRRQRMAFETVEQAASLERPGDAPRQAARGEAVMPTQDVTVGELAGGCGRLRGHVAQLRLRSGRLTAGEAPTCAANLTAPGAFVRLVD